LLGKADGFGDAEEDVEGGRGQQEAELDEAKAAP
jgi:hypothetical protein